MSHDLYASWACAEIAHYIRENQCSFFSDCDVNTDWSVAAGREGGRLWPLADAVISTSNSRTSEQIQIALEFKRINEGLHGTLTAIGQSLAYLHKGYHSSIIVIPENYSSHDQPGQHIKEILDLTTVQNAPIGIFTYQGPDVHKVRPFENKISCLRTPLLTTSTLVTNSPNSRPKASTLWAHVREGMSYPDAFYKYCKEVKFVTASLDDIPFNLLPELERAVERVKPGANPIQYLSYTKNNSILDKTWLYTWFKYYFHETLRPIFYKDDITNEYRVNRESTKILQSSDKYANFLSGRNDSIKEVLVKKLNKQEISEDTAWEYYVEKIRKQAHSYREVIDSGLYHLNLIDPDGKLTKAGYAFVDAADKENTVYGSSSMQILRGTSLIYGNFSTFLHYIYRISEESFLNDSFAFTSRTDERLAFDSQSYKAFLFEKMRNELSLILTSSARSSANPRKAFQAEIPYLKHLGIITNITSPFRTGVGLMINWPIVQESIDYMQINNL